MREKQSEQKHKKRKEKREGLDQKCKMPWLRRVCGGLGVLSSPFV
jgi:hypothetical protein